MSREIGILMTDSRFERLPGDIGNPVTWNFPVRYKILEGVTAATMISLKDANPLQTILSAADDLIESGVAGITTSCGFLGLYQQELADHCTVPVATSSLLQVPMVSRLIPADKQVAILTYDANELSDSHLRAVGVPVDTPVVGVNTDSTFYRWIMDGIQPIEVAKLRADIHLLAQELMEEHPNTGAIVAECTNLSPFSSDIANITGLPVFDTTTLVSWFQRAIQPIDFTQEISR